MSHLLDALPLDTKMTLKGLKLIAVLNRLLNSLWFSPSERHWLEYLCCFFQTDNASALLVYVYFIQCPNCFHAIAFLIVNICHWKSDKWPLFFSFTNTVTFSYPPLHHLPCSHKFGPDPPLHLRPMMCRCKLCISLIRLVLPLSPSCTPSFRTVTYGRQLCGEPQSVFTARRTLSHAAAQLPNLRGAYSSLPASGHVFLHWCDPAPLLHASFSPAAAMLERVGWTVNGL